jgi:HD-GYP domain-containing protein (c-di-GMP phosphodiesterase class II)
VVIEPDLEAEPSSVAGRARATAFGFRSSASLPMTIDGKLDGVLTVYAAERGSFDDHAREVLEELTRTLGFGVERLRDRADLHQAFVSSIDLVAAVVESRDPYTAGHQALVAELARAIGTELGLDEHRLDGLAFAARIHDVGKIGVPIDILCRPGILTPEELAVVRRHATIGWEIAGHFTWPWPVADIVHQHHEQFDGSGYPQGLRGEEILLESRIVSVADCYQAIASRRPYRDALGEDVAYRTIVDGSGTRFDPDVVDAFVRVIADGFTFSSAQPGQD